MLFWPYMATCNYDQIVTKFLLEKNIDFIEMENNTMNVPKEHPIERFWAICKSEYDKQKKTPQSIHQFRIIWSEIMKKVSENSFRKQGTNWRFPEEVTINRVRWCLSLFEAHKFMKLWFFHVNKIYFEIWNDCWIFTVHL